jgi:hypothetical protein
VNELRARIGVACVVVCRKRLQIDQLSCAVLLDGFQQLTGQLRVSDDYVVGQIGSSSWSSFTVEEVLATDFVITWEIGTTSSVFYAASIYLAGYDFAV